MTDPFLDFVSGFSELLGRDLPVPDVVSPKVSGQGPCAVVLSPHPDDECLTGGLPFRLKQEAGWKIVNVAMTLGSNPDHRKERLGELHKACDVLGFEVVNSGFESVREIRAEMVERLVEIFKQYQPVAVFLPHAKDQHTTHIGVHELGMAALGKMPESFACSVFQTEYWQPQETPNCLIVLKKEDVALLLRALCCHAGQNARNAFHRTFPAYLIDNVRRGSERVSGEGAKGLAFDFAMLYRFDRWEKGALREVEGKSFVVGPEGAISVLVG